MNIRKAKQAASSVISLILILALVLTSMAAVFLFGIPQIEQEKDKYNARSVEEGYEKIDKRLTDMTKGLFDAEVEEEISVADGEVSFDEKSNRYIISYSYDDTVDFDVYNLDRNDGNDKRF